MRDGEGERRSHVNEVVVIVVIDIYVSMSSPCPVSRVQNTANRPVLIVYEINYNDIIELNLVNSFS